MEEFSLLSSTANYFPYLTNTTARTGTATPAPTALHPATGTQDQIVTSELDALIKNQITSHPRYPVLLEVFMDCQKVTFLPLKFCNSEKYDYHNSQEITDFDNLVELCRLGHLLRFSTDSQPFRKSSSCTKELIAKILLIQSLINSWFLSSLFFLRDENYKNYYVFLFLRKIKGDKHSAS
jgi:KNOX1 domain